MVREHEIRRPELAQHRRVRRDVRVPLPQGELAEETHLEPLVAVEDERGQQTALQLGTTTRAPPRLKPPDAGPGRRPLRRARRGSTRARAPGCRRSTPFLRGGTRARAAPAWRGGYARRRRVSCASGRRTPSASPTATTRGCAGTFLVSRHRQIRVCARNGGERDADCDNREPRRDRAESHRKRDDRHEGPTQEEEAARTSRESTTSTSTATSASGKLLSGIRRSRAAAVASASTTATASH